MITATAQHKQATAVSAEVVLALLELNITEASAPPLQAFCTGNETKQGFMWYIDLKSQASQN